MIAVLPVFITKRDLFQTKGKLLVYIMYSKKISN